MKWDRHISEWTSADWVRAVNETFLPVSLKGSNRFRSRFELTKAYRHAIADHFGESVPWQEMGIGPQRYYAYLKSAEWASKVQGVRSRCGGRCERCEFGLHEHTHHQTYDNLYREPLDDLVALCAECHAVVHARSDSDPKEIAPWDHVQQQAFLKTLGTDRLFLRRVKSFLGLSPVQRTRSSSLSARS